MHALLVLVLSLLYPRISTNASVAAAQDAPAYAETYEPVDVYNPIRSPYVDLGLALQEAKRSHRNILLEVGGDWCVWCHIMDRFYSEHADLLALRDKDFINVKVNMSPANENKSFLSQYPRIPGYPHIFVLDADNKLIKSQSTSELESGKSYNLKRFMQFLEKYAPAPAEARSGQ